MLNDERIVGWQWRVPKDADALPPAVHQTIVCFDVEGFGDRTRTNLHQVAIRNGLYHSLCTAFDRSGVSWNNCYREDRGDGVMVLVPANVPKSLLVSCVPYEIVEALRRHNQTHDVRARIRLRMAIGAGEIQHDGHGVTGTALNVAFRLLEADALKYALAGSSGVLAVIVSPYIRKEVITNTPDSNPASYQPVHVSVKETEMTAWICLPDDPRPPRQKVMRSTARTSSPLSVSPRRHLIGARATLPAYHSYLDRRYAGPAVARMLLGVRRRLRKAQELTLRVTGAAIGVTESKVRRVETEETGSKQHDVAAALLIFSGMTGIVERVEMLALTAPTNMRGWMHTFSDGLSDDMKTWLELEQAADLVRGYEPNVIPHLLQTADYTRALMRLGNRDLPESYIERCVGLLIAGQRILYRREPAKLWMIIEEAAICDERHADPRTMRHQLQHLIKVAELPNVTIQVMPSRVRMVGGGAVTKLRFSERDLGQVVRLEHFANAIYLDRRAEIDHYRGVLDRLSVHAATPAKSVAIIRNMLEGI